MDLIRYFKSVTLPDILDAVHQFTGDTFTAQVFGDGHFQSHSQLAFVRYQPARNVLAIDFHIRCFNHGFTICQLKGVFPVPFQFGNSFLRHLTYTCGYGFHTLSEFRSQLLEVAFHLLHQHAGFFYKLKFLHVHFIQNQVFHCLDMTFLLFIDYRNHDALQRLAHLDVHLTAQGQYHGSNILSHPHTGFQFLVYQTFVRFGEVRQVYRYHMVTFRHLNQVHIQAVGIERSNRSHQFRHRFQTSVQSLVSRQFVLRHRASPETFPVQAHIPVAQVIVYKVCNQTSCLCRFVIIEASIYIFYQRIEQRQNPAVDFRTF